MASEHGEMPPQEIFKLVADGAKHTIVQTGGSGSLGVTIPKHELRERDLERGDEIVIVPGADSDSLRLYFPPDDA